MEAKSRICSTSAELQQGRFGVHTQNVLLLQQLSSRSEFLGIVDATIQLLLLLQQQQLYSWINNTRFIVAAAAAAVGFNSQSTCARRRLPRALRQLILSWSSPMQQGMHAASRFGYVGACWCTVTAAL